MGWPPYQTVARLYAIAEMRWPEIDAAYPQVNLVTLPMHRFCNFVYAWFVQRIDPEKRDMYDMMLTEPLEGQAKKVTPATTEAEGADFMATMMMHQQFQG